MSGKNYFYVFLVYIYVKLVLALKWQSSISVIVDGVHCGKNVSKKVETHGEDVKQNLKLKNNRSEN